MQPVFEGSTISWEIRDDTLYLSGSGDLVFRTKEDGVYDIPWYYLDFTHVVFEGNITSIGPETFHTSDLVDVDIPDSVTVIHPLAFCKCQDLRTVKLGKGVKVIGEYAFQDCVSLESIETNDAMEVIGYNAFENCSSLKGIGLPETLKEIGEDSFLGCSSMTGIRIPASVEVVSNNPFAYCSSLSRIDVDPGNFFYTSVGGALLNKKKEMLLSVPCALSEYDVPAEVRGIGRNAFRGGSVKEALLSSDVVHIDSGAFQDCSDLVKADLPSIAGIPGDAFSGCSSLVKIYIPRCVRIGSGAFRKCTSMKELVLPERLEVIEEGGFISCSGLENVEFNDRISSVGMYAFNGCTSLKELVIPESLMDIGEEAFYGCTSLEKVTMCFCLGDEEDYFPENVEIVYFED